MNHISMKIEKRLNKRQQSYMKPIRKRTNNHRAKNQVNLNFNSSVSESSKKNFIELLKSNILIILLAAFILFRPLVIPFITKALVIITNINWPYTIPLDVTIAFSMLALMFIVVFRKY